MRKLAVVLIVVCGLVGLGHWSGSQPERDSVSAAQTELGIPFTARFVDVGEVTLHVVFAGPEEGPPVILLHGFPEFWYAWRGPAAVLARAGFRVILPDQRGYNLSDKPGDPAAYRTDHLVGDITGLMDALGYARVSLGVQDQGGRVGWRTVIEHPDRIERFAVVDVPHPLAKATGGEKTVTWFRTFMKIPWLPGFTARLGNWLLLTKNLGQTSVPDTFDDEELDQLRSAWDRDGAFHSMANWYRAESWPLEGDGRVATPTLVIAAENDVFIPGSATRASMAFLDNGELLELGSGTHWVTAEESERIGKVLADFFGPQTAR